MTCEITQRNAEKCTFIIKGLPSKEELSNLIDIFFTAGEYNKVFSEGDGRVFEKNLKIKKLFSSAEKPFKIIVGLGEGENQFAIVTKKDPAVSGASADKEFMIVNDAIKIYFNR